MKELHVRIFGIEKQYFAELLNPPKGAEGFELPPATSEEWPVLLKLPPALPGGRTLLNLQATLLNSRRGAIQNELNEVGNYLFHFLFGASGNYNPLYRFWVTCFRLSQQTTGMRFVLHLADDDLVGVPWELTCDDNGRYLAAWPGIKPHTLVRMGHKPDDLSPEAVDHSETMRALLVICHAPQEDDTIMGPEEALQVDAAIYRLLPWKLDLRVLVRPTLRETLDWCAEWQPHIFHYIGHGDFDGEVSYLKFYDPNQPSDIPLDPLAMANFFRGGAPRLVILNACRSGQVGDADPATNPNSLRATQNLSKVLIEGGTQAVVAMQADIDGLAAATLMGRFYQALTEGVPVDVALTAARRAYFETVGLGVQQWDWAVPTLYQAEGVRLENVLKLNPENNETHVLQPGQAASERYRRYISDLQLRVRILVGREAEKLQLERAFLRRELNNIAPVTLLYGEPAMGKTNLLYWLSERSSRLERPFIYADFGQVPLDYWDTLRLLRDGQLESKTVGIRLANELNPDLNFNLFNYALNSRLVKDYANQFPVAPESNTAVPDLAVGKNPATEMQALGTLRAGENPYETITEAFWDSLYKLARKNGLLIFLDHVDRLFSGEVNKIYDYIIKRVLNPDKYPKAKKVRIVLSLEAPSPVITEFSERPWDFMLDDQSVTVLRLTGFEPQELYWLGRLWARRYFVSHTPISLQGKKFTPEQVDQYIAALLKENFGRRPQRPGNFIGEILDRDNLARWLNGL